MAEKHYTATQAIGLPRQVVRANQPFKAEAELGDRLVKEGKATAGKKAPTKAQDDDAGTTGTNPQDPGTESDQGPKE